MKKKNSRQNRPTDNQNGQAVVELALIIPFLAIVLWALILIYQYGTMQVGALASLRQEMRISMTANSSGSFHAKTVRQTIRLDLPGKMKQVFKTPFISQELTIDFFEGSYHGFELTKYHNRGKTKREIKF